jgi:hypothetical protein
MTCDLDRKILSCNITLHFGCLSQIIWRMKRDLFVQLAFRPHQPKDATRLKMTKETVDSTYRLRTYGEKTHKTDLATFVYFIYKINTCITRNSDLQCTSIRSLGIPL